ncbi:MAG: hypothetical protein Q9213_008076 [Squamulea squamosa]
MEPFSIAASLLTVLEATAVVSKAATTLYRNIREAPKELAQLSTRISQTRARLDVQLRLYQSLSNGNLKFFLPDDALNTLHTDLENAKTWLKSVQNTIAPKTGHSNGKQSFDWIMRDQRKVMKIVAHLRAIDNNLSLMLTTLSLSLCLMSQWQSLNRGMKISMNYAMPTTWDTVVHKAPAHVPDASETNIVRSSITIGHQKDELRSVSWMIALCRFPNVLSSYAVCVTVQLWLFSLGWPCLRHSLAVKRIIPYDSEFVKACAAGDVMKARQLAWSGRGSPSSIDETGKPYAISSGSYELVKFLLHNGASPDELRIPCHVSPLQEACSYGHSEIARLLLAKGAFLEHVDASGRTAFTMLWFQLSRPFCRVNFLRILLAYSPMFSVFEPSEGPSPLACAAMRGQAKDLKLFMDSGVYMNIDGKPGDRLINHSLAGSNPATFDFLMPLTPKEWISELDYLGRGPLHRALEYPSHNAKEIVKRLLDAGADPHLRDVDGNDPGDTARICDVRAAKDGLQDLGYPSNFRAFFDALQSSGIDVQLGDDDSLWWPS